MFMLKVAGSNTFFTCYKTKLTHAKDRAYFISFTFHVLKG